MEVFPDFVDEHEDCAVNYIGKPLFPIFGSDATFHCIVGDWQDETPSPIVYISDIIETNHSFVSLTSMIQTAAEAIQANALNFSSKSYSKWDEEKYAEIYFKYNSNILELSVKALKQHLLIAEPNSLAEEKAENNFIEDIANLYVKKQNLSSEQLDYEMLEPLVIALEDEDKRIRNLARKALEELG